MRSDVTVTETATHVVVSVPYDPRWVSYVRDIDGRWSVRDRVWRFPLRFRREAYDLLLAQHAWVPEPTKTVDVRMFLENKVHGRDIFFAGRRIVTKPQRDTAAQYARGVSLIQGYFLRSYGTVSAPALRSFDVVLEVRGLPVEALANVTDDEDQWWIVEEFPVEGDTETTAVDVTALTAEREALMSRLAEIDTALALAG